MLSAASGLKHANRSTNSASLLRVQYIRLVQSNNKKTNGRAAAFCCTISHPSAQRNTRPKGIF